MPRRTTAATRFSEVVRLKIDAPLLTMIEKECERNRISQPSFFRNLIRQQQGLMNVARSSGAPAVKPLTNRKHTKKPFNLYLDKEMHGFLAGMSYRTGCPKSGLMSVLACDYFGILPLRFTNPIQTS